MSAPDYGTALVAIVTSLERTGVPYFVGGSVASVVYGDVRTTYDVDIVVELEFEQVGPLVSLLSHHFVVDELFLRDAIQHHSSCNLIHRTSGFKVDLFLRRNRPFSRSEMDRSRSLEVLPGVHLRIASAEDCVLSKLEWFEKADRASDRQWRDVLGILKGQQGALDLAYLRRWAHELALSDLLERALVEAYGAAP